GTAIAVAEEAALAEGRFDAWSDPRILQDRSRDKSAEAEETGVERPWSVGNDVLAHRRGHAVGADQQIAFRARAVGEMRDDWPVGAILDPRQALVEMHLDRGIPGLVDQHLVQHGAVHVDRGLAEPRLHVPVDRGEPFALVGVEVEALGYFTAADDVVG